jgi:hypothetical protein
MRGGSIWAILSFGDTMAHNCDKDIDTSYSEISEDEDKCYFFMQLKSRHFI